MGIADTIFLGLFIYVLGISALIIYFISEYYAYLKRSALGKIVLVGLSLILGLAILTIGGIVALTFLPQSFCSLTYLGTLIYLSVILTITLVVVSKLAPKFVPSEVIKKIISTHESIFSEKGLLPNLYFVKVISEHLKQKSLANYLSYMLGKLTGYKVASKYKYLRKGVLEITPELRDLFNIELFFIPRTTGLKVKIPSSKFSLNEGELICIHFQGFWEEFVSKYLGYNFKRVLFNLSAEKDSFICELSLEK